MLNVHFTQKRLSTEVKKKKKKNGKYKRLGEDGKQYLHLKDTFESFQ